MRVYATITNLSSIEVLGQIVVVAERVVHPSIHLSMQVTLHRNISKFRSPQHHFETFTSTRKLHKLFAGPQKIERNKMSPTHDYDSLNAPSATPKLDGSLRWSLPSWLVIWAFWGNGGSGWTQSSPGINPPKIASEGCEGLDIGILSS